MHPQFEVAQETPFHFDTAQELAAPTSCRPTAAARAGSLLLVNHWVDTSPAPRVSIAREVNARAFLDARLDALPPRARLAARRSWPSTSTARATRSARSTVSTASPRQGDDRSPAARGRCAVRAHRLRRAEMVQDSSRTPGVVGDLMPDLTADLARLVAIPSISSPGYPEPTPACSRRTSSWPSCSAARACRTSGRSSCPAPRRSSPARSPRRTARRPSCSTATTTSCPAGDESLWTLAAVRADRARRRALRPRQRGLQGEHDQPRRRAARMGRASRRSASRSSSRARRRSAAAR